MILPFYQFPKPEGCIMGEAISGLWIPQSLTVIDSVLVLYPHGYYFSLDRNHFWHRRQGIRDMNSQDKTDK